MKGPIEELTIGWIEGIDPFYLEDGIEVPFSWIVGRYVKRCKILTNYQSDRHNDNQNDR